MKKEEIIERLKKLADELPTSYDFFSIFDIGSRESYIDGLNENMSVQDHSKLKNIYVVIGDDNKWGMYDAKNNVYLRPFSYDFSVSLDDNLIMFNLCNWEHEDGTPVFFNKIAYDFEKGKTLLDLNKIKEVSKEASLLDEEMFSGSGGIAEQANDSGFSTICIDEKMGLISADNKTTYINPEYDVLMLAWGAIENLCNSITKKNQIYCVVKNDTKFGVVDLANNVILPLQFTSFEFLENWCIENLKTIEINR